MSVRRFTSLGALLVLALLILCVGAIPQQRYFEASDNVAALRFGQSIALSDFDADGLVDEARLEGSSWRKSVGILLSGTNKRSFLHFSGVRSDYGSLFAQDVDNDGATDLVWTDLLHADDVIVWLGDGTGQFQRASRKTFSDRFVLTHSSAAAPGSSDHEAAIISTTNRPLDQLLVRKCRLQPTVVLPSLRFDSIAALSPALSQPAGRSPPFLLS